MDSQKLRSCLREIGAELISNGKVQAKGSFIGIAITYFDKQHSVQNTVCLDSFMKELSTRLWKTGRSRINPTAENVIAFMLKTSGVNERLLINRIIY